VAVKSTRWKKWKAAIFLFSREISFNV